MQRMKRGLDIVLPLAGVAAILGAVVFVTPLYAQLGVVIVGILLIEGGMWRLARPLLANERRHHALRVEVDRFIELVRELNGAALRRDREATPEASDAFEEVEAALRDSVTRMAEVAGKADLEMAGSESAPATTAGPGDPSPDRARGPQRR